MATEPTKGKVVKGDKGGAVFVVGRARYPVRKPGVWSLIDACTTEKLAKEACYDRWCAYIKVQQDAPVSLTVTLDKGQVCFVNE
jgi:hypothetical protein